MQLEGREEISRFHTVHFTGNESLATLRVNKFLGLQKTAAGWRELEATTASGETTRVWVDGDKNRRTIRTEQATKKLASLLQEALPAEKIAAKRRDGKVYCKWTPLAKILFTDESEFTIEWNRMATILGTVNKDWMVEEVKKTCRGRADEPTEWV